MYSVTKSVEFCYGHRLLDHAGPCRHPHGHNAIAEIEVSSPALDAMNMVIDFAEVKSRVERWIDRELDHRMILRSDDPLVGALRDLGEPMYLLESNPTVERHRAADLRSRTRLRPCRLAGHRVGDAVLFCDL
jgi:6-pyruvoyltetrahydropterin/6-carboxytetrahydropterin synthase